MSTKPIPQRVVLVLVATAMVLVIGTGVLLALAAVLRAMNDLPGSVVLNYIALGSGALLAVNLICLILALGLNSAGGPDPPDEAQG